MRQPLELSCYVFLQIWLSWTDLALTDAIKVAASSGFDAVECHWPFDVPSKSVHSTLKGIGLPMVSLNTRPGILKLVILELQQCLDERHRQDLT